MQLRIKRSQKTVGMMSKSVAFVLDAQAILSAEEQANVKKYALGSEVVYASENFKEQASTAAGGGIRGAFAAARAALSLRITVDSLTRGQHIEAKSLNEVLAAEEAIHTACENIVEYIAVASKFDDGTQTIEIKPKAA